MSARSIRRPMRSSAPHGIRSLCLEAFCATGRTRTDSGKCRVKEGRGGVETWVIALVPFLARQTEAGICHIRFAETPTESKSALGLRGRSVAGVNYRGAVR